MRRRTENKILITGGTGFIGTRTVKALNCLIFRYIFAILLMLNERVFTLHDANVQKTKA